MITMLVISILLVALYVGAATWIKKELPDSISAMVYVLPEGGWSWLWTVWLMVVAILTFAPAVQLMDAHSLGILGFVPMVLLTLVAAWPLLDKEHLSRHYSLAIAAGVLSQVCVCVLCPWWLITWVALVVMVIDSLLFPDTKHAYDHKACFIAEAICYISLVGATFTA